MQLVCLSLQDMECKSRIAIYLLLTPWSRVLLGELTGFKLVKNSPHFMEPEGSLPRSQVPATCPYPEPARSIHSISPGPRLTLWFFRNICFCGEELLALRPTPKLEDHLLLAVCDCLFNIFAATLHIGGCSQTQDAPCRGDKDPLITGQCFSDSQTVLTGRTLQLMIAVLDVLDASADVSSVTSRS